MALKNARSRSPNTFDKIQRLLTTHGARRVMMEYSPTGLIFGISFQLEINGQEVVMKLPARIEQVAIHMYKDVLSGLSESKQEQAYRTAWANIRDWLDAQFAMIDTQMVKVEEVFLPYIMVDNNQTLFEKFEANPRFLLPHKID